MAMLYPKAWRPDIGVPQTRTEKATSMISLRTPQSVRTRPEVLPICTLLVELGAEEIAIEAYQEDNRTVQCECD